MNPHSTSFYCISQGSLDSLRTLNCLTFSNLIDVYDKRYSALKWYFKVKVAPHLLPSFALKRIFLNSETFHV